jgi:hypothetical protein
MTKIEAAAYAKKMEKVNLSKLIRNIEVEEWKSLFTHPSNNLLNYADRKRYYKITLHYEK